MTPKLPPDEAWQALEQLVAEENAAELDRIDALTGPELDRELAKEGLDPAAERAHAEAVIRRVRASRQGAPPAKAPRAPALWARLAAAATVLGPVGYLALNQVAAPLTEVAAAPDGGAASLDAHSLRQSASLACNMGKGALCLELLDLAKRRDPEGDEGPFWKMTRSRAMELIGKPDGAPSPP